VPLAADVQAGSSRLRRIWDPAYAPAGGRSTQVVGRVAPAGMIFVPSKDGQPFPMEFTADEDLGRGATCCC
jgi:hypothetical protein